MGLFSKMTGIFKSEAPGAVARPTSPPLRATAGTSSGASLSNRISGSSPLIPSPRAGASATAIAEAKPPRTPPSPSAPVEVLPTKAGPPAKPPRQELVEELQQNYREVVKIVRRANEHMDKADARAEKVARLAEQVLDSTRRLPEAVSEAIEKAQGQQLEALHMIARRHEEGTERVENTMAQLGVQMEVAGQSHGQLVDSMTGFHETMHEMSVSNTRTADALDASIAQKRAADDRLATMIVQNQRWMIGIVAGIMVFAASAFIVAIIALMQLQS